MTHRHEAIDVVLDDFLRAWHAGESPDSAQYVARASPADRDELEQLLGAFAQVAPTVEPTPERAAQLAADPAVAHLSGLEAGWWEQQGLTAQAQQVGALAAELAAGDGGDGSDEAPWGARLRALRESAGVSLASLGRDFAQRFGLGVSDASRAPEVLGALESGAVPAGGVAARAARALEELLSAPRGALAGGQSPAFGNVLLRAALPEQDDQREQFGELLREVDDALTQSDPGGDLPPDSLRSLLGG